MQEQKPEAPGGWAGSRMTRSSRNQRQEAWRSQQGELVSAMQIDLPYDPLVPRSCSESKNDKGSSILGKIRDFTHRSLHELLPSHVFVVSHHSHIPITHRRGGPAEGSSILGKIRDFTHRSLHELLPSHATNTKNKSVLSFYSVLEYEQWKKTLGGNASGWSIKYYKGLGTTTSAEGGSILRILPNTRRILSRWMTKMTTILN
ncbi:hypothetical protein GUJ93_ZPchr0009g2087 [Zizania palustris]|uniref:DNA topoisomerase (ATP-hydrolyzing) n=1 Tax=Zizania palustris TaxID=103762 RepID=A0A8J5R4S4_ZIZPA|nr:hypothetical protein GUJ93_ZPchr0009g2087 [Zizania palustris]